MVFSIKPSIKFDISIYPASNKHLIERIPREEFTSVEFGKGSNNTILLLAKQVAEDIGQTVIFV